jgi:hypothetical protein
MYITTLFNLAQEPNKIALKKYMDLYLAADGAYAELMEDQLEHLFLEQPKKVVENWSIIASNRRALSDLNRSLSAEQKRNIMSNVHPYCSRNVSACNGLKAILQ